MSGGYHLVYEVKLPSRLKHFHQNLSFRQISQKKLFSPHSHILPALCWLYRSQPDGSISLMEQLLFPLYRISIVHRYKPPLKPGRMALWSSESHWYLLLQLSRPDTSSTDILLWPAKAPLSVLVLLLVFLSHFLLNML